MECFGPKKLTLKDVGSTTLGAFIAGFLGSILLFLGVFFIGSSLELPGEVTGKSLSGNGSEISILIPILLSLMTMIALVVVNFTTYSINSSIQPDRYNKTSVHSSQIAIFLVILYMIITPVYLVLGGGGQNFVIGIFLLNTFVGLFGVNLILDILNNYRYVLVSVYSSLFSMVISLGLFGVLFSIFSTGIAKMIILILVFPVYNALLIGFKDLLQLGYYSYYQASGVDPIGDIFNRIAQDEEEEYRTAIESNI